MKKIKGGGNGTDNAELNILQKVSHPNLTKVHDHFCAHGHLYLILELAECELIRRPRESPQENPRREEIRSAGIGH
jgi:hypothetical protein